MTKVYTEAEAADLLHCSRRTLAQWRRTPGAGPAFFRSRGKVLYTEQAIAAYLERHTYASTGEWRRSSATNRQPERTRRKSA